MTSLHDLAVIITWDGVCWAAKYESWETRTRFVVDACNFSDDNK